MTIVLATQRQSFAVLAAEQRRVLPRGDGTYEDQPPREKVIVHPSLPLAFAFSGSMWLPSDGEGGQETYDLIAAFANQLGNDANPFTASATAEGLRKRIRAHVGSAEVRVAVHLALVVRGQAECGLLLVGNDAGNPERFYPNCRLPLRPTALADFYTDQRLARLHDESVGDSLTVVQLARQLVRNGIDYEESNYPAGQRQCGLRINVALVTAAGAVIDPDS
jgi:hypothetical protein